MKKHSLVPARLLLSALGAAAVLGLAVPSTATAGNKKNTWSYSNSSRLDARIGKGEVKIKRSNGSTVSVIQTAQPKVDGVRFMNSDKDIAIASHGSNRDSAVVELFDVRSGKRKDRIRVKDIRHGQPSWAAWIKN